MAIGAGISAAAAQTLFRVVLGSGSTTDTLDPATFPDSFNGVFGWGSIRSSLTEVSAKGEIGINVIREAEDAHWDAIWMKKGWCLSCWSDRPTADLMFYNYMNAFAKTVAHPDVVAPNWNVVGMKITQRWWFA